MAGNFAENTIVMSRSVSVSKVRQAGHGFFLFRNRKNFGCMLRDVFRGGYKMSLLTIAASVLLIAYIVFPFDLIPDHIPVLGWMDDGVALYILLKRLSAETQRYIRHKALERKIASIE